MERLPVRPPLEPMLARLARTLPEGGLAYEPKWDGFRCLVFRDGEQVDMRSRNDRPFARYFPEVVEAFRVLRTDPIVVDGEIVVMAEGALSFEALMLRLHPAASRVERLRRETPARFIAFDLLAAGDEDLRRAPFSERRDRLARALEGAPPAVVLTPSTTDPGEARRWLAAPPSAGIDGVVAKPLAGPYQPGKRVLTKVKTERTIDCVVGGARLFEGGMVASLLLGLYGGDGVLRSIGVASSFTDAQRRALHGELMPLAMPLDAHPWARGYGLDPSPVGRLSGSGGRWTPDMEHDWVPLRPDRVCEVTVTQIDRDRLRYPARFKRWRPDRDPRSCTIEQLGDARLTA